MGESCGDQGEERRPLHTHRHACRERRGTPWRAVGGEMRAVWGRGLRRRRTSPPLFSRRPLAQEPLLEVLDLMGHTDVLVGMHGAGWTNALFVKHGASALQLYPYGWRLPRNGHMIRGCVFRNKGRRGARGLVAVGRTPLELWQGARRPPPPARPNHAQQTPRRRKPPVPFLPAVNAPLFPRHPRAGPTTRRLCWRRMWSTRSG